MEKSNIVLIGFMGTGKTAVGKRLAAILNKEFYDSDQEIEDVTGMSIPQIFARYGEIRFRSEENLAIARLAQHENCVIATGGGVTINPENMRLLREKGTIVCLTAKPEIIYERVKRRNNRPLLKKGNFYQSIVKLMGERAEVYREADFFLDTSELDFQDIIAKIIEFVEGKGCEESQSL